ncbi:MAG: hypothetical protein GXO21_05410 [Aquificae bacterium]|nr:hypothetical protein [Aquificota bacterium]
MAKKNGNEIWERVKRVIEKGIDDGYFSIITYDNHAHSLEVSYNGRNGWWFYEYEKCLSDGCFWVETGKWRVFSDKEALREALEWLEAHWQDEVIEISAGDEHITI